MGPPRYLPFHLQPAQVGFEYISRWVPIELSLPDRDVPASARGLRVGETPVNVNLLPNQDSTVGDVSGYQAPLP